ncbi:hypothetical protein DRQ36_02780 [bacterium]|nr:MAG: hypothetical protein DRQ36_02780 [bacterium]
MEPDGKYKRSGFLTRIFDHIFFLRPLLILPIWAPLLLGYWAAGGRGLDIIFLRLLLLGILLGGSIYGINQLYDVEGDRLNRKNLPLALGFVSRPAAWVITLLCDIGALVVAGFLGPITAILAAIGVAMGILYSHPRWRFKDKPWAALALNAIGHGALVYVIGWSSIGIFSWAIFLRMIPYALAYGGVYLVTTVPDAEGDIATGKRTLTVICGETRTVALAYILIIAASISSIFLSEPAIYLTGLFSAPFYIYAAIKGGRNYVTANKVAVLVLNLCICFYIFQYIIFLAIIVIFSRIYYSVRLKIRYP